MIPTDCYVTQPLLNALAIIDPYPWTHHVEVVLAAEWGSHLPEVRAGATALWRAGQVVRNRNRKAVMDFARRRTLVLRTSYYNAVFRGRPQSDEPFSIALGMLLPVSPDDTFRMEGELVELDDEPAVATACELVLAEASLPGLVEMRVSPSYRPLREWAMAFRLMVIDVVDADRLLRRVSAELKRSYNDVLRSVYPSARAVFPDLVYTARGPVGRSGLRGALHPADQDMIRATLDRAAAGMGLPEAQRPLALPELMYQVTQE